MPEPPPTTVHLGTDEVEFVFGGEPQRLPCEIVLDTEPRPQLSFKVAGLNPWLVLTGFSQQQFSIHIVHADVSCDALFVSTNDGIAWLCPESEPVVVGRSEDLRQVEFDLINFPKFWALASPSARLPEDHLDMDAAGWYVEIRPPRKSPDVEAFRSTLYSVTHSCAMRRSDNAVFSSAEAQQFLNVFHEVISFAAGRWVAPVFVRGFGIDQEAGWKEWGTRPLHPNLGRLETWFDSHHAHTLAEVLSGACELRKDAERAETFHSSLYWYLRSTGGAAGVDGGIILLQAALELLSWQLFVADRKALSREGFGRLPADDQLRLLIESCKIPTGIPPGLGELLLKAKELNWTDGPKALAAVRNLLVHPGKHKRIPYHDVWRLAEWYVELVLLRMLSFGGGYSDRTKVQRWVGAVDTVPWAAL
jgi:hypothetical protein